jgi:[ribosomal protein S18]-alanine N-acetyltransferase
MLIRAAVSADVPALMTLEKHAATAAHWSADRYEALFHDANSNRVALVIEEDQLQGFVIASAVGVEWEIENMVVAGPARRRGLGTRLLGELLDIARARGGESVFLEVRESNRVARALYEKWAFAESGRRKKYYKDPQEDAVVYRLVLN